MTDKCVKDVGLEDLEPWPDEVRCFTKAGMRSYVPKGEADFTWHLMADELPNNENARYIILGRRGVLYIAFGFQYWNDGSACFFVGEERYGYLDFDKVRAWAEIPPYEEARP